MQFEIDLVIVGKVVRLTEVIHGNLSKALPILLLGLAQEGWKK